MIDNSSENEVCFWIDNVDFFRTKLRLCRQKAGETEKKRVGSFNSLSQKQAEANPGGGVICFFQDSGVKSIDTELTQ